MDEQIYGIEDGVRRVKAAWLCGHDTIDAQINGGVVFSVPLRSLRSPKAEIEDIGPRGGDWGVIYRMTQRGQEMPPIDIIPGNSGMPIRDVEVAEDELELFRQRYPSDP